MATTTEIENLPGDWLSEERFGDWGDDPVATAYALIFDDWLEKNYPHLTRCGDQLIGPASYRFGEPFDEKSGAWKMQRDTPRPSELKPLPEQGVYAEFAEEIDCDWNERLEAKLKEMKNETSEN